MTPRELQIKEAAEADLAAYIRLVDKNRVLGHVHLDVIRWWERQDKRDHQLLLLPRDHMKSALVAFRVAWRLAKDPTLRVLYISSTSNLAEKQLGFIKSILSSPVHQRFWPDHINPEEGSRRKWTEKEIMLDHPLRDEHLIRDPSVFCAGLTTSVTGMHCDIAVLDDIVVFENAYTKEGRDKVKSQYSLLASIEGADAEEWVVGTRYHPKDLYGDMLEMVEDVYDKNGEVVDSVPIYEVFERAVEEEGVFLWPRQQRSDGKWFGFDRSILEKKRGQYLDRKQFRAQYYNDPSDPEGSGIKYDQFRYWEGNLLTRREGWWYYNGLKLNLTAAIDFAYSTARKADYSCLVVTGEDPDGNVFVLDIDRFKSDAKISDYYKCILRTFQKWGYRKIAMETTVAQKAIVNELKNTYLMPNGINIKIIDTRPVKNKEERIAAVLEPRYDQQMVYHAKGGNWEILEEELVNQNPAHDDVKDALTMAIEHSVRPQRVAFNTFKKQNVYYHPRFGGHV